MNATEPRLDQPAEQGTGCVSVSCDPLIELVKICEAFDPDNGTLWIDQDFRFGSSDGTSLHPHPAKRNHFSTRKRRRLRRNRSSPLLAPHGG